MKQICGALLGRLNGAGFLASMNYSPGTALDALGAHWARSGMTGMVPAKARSFRTSQRFTLAHRQIIPCW